MPRIPRVILLIESSRASGRALLRGVADYSHDRGPWSFSWEPSGLEKVLPLLEIGDADGIILRDTRKVEEILAYGFPTVVIGHQKTEIPGLVNVVTDSAAIGRMGAEHLIHCGFKQFAFCGYAKTDLENTTWSEIRRKFFSERLEEAGYAAPAYYEFSTAAQDWQKEWRSLARWLAALPKPVGLMACNDDCGQRVMEACKLGGLTVPDMVGIIGVDNDEVVCGLTDPPLSSVAINFQRAGYEAAVALDAMMRRAPHTAPKRITAVASHLAARRSTDFVAAEEPQMTKALHFIRDNTRRVISVDEVVRAAGLSRRAMEKRFRKLLGRSILEEIRRVRTDHIARMLVETDLPVAQIADVLGFADVQHIARYFRADKQVSPLAYRQKFGRLNPSLWRSQDGGFFPRSGVVGTLQGG
jgi:LacI family transcriptional regulator